jgi:hypothetical protein
VIAKSLAGKVPQFVQDSFVIEYIWDDYFNAFHLDKPDNSPYTDKGDVILGQSVPMKVVSVKTVQY